MIVYLAVVFRVSKNFSLDVLAVVKILTKNCFVISGTSYIVGGGSVAEWLACWTQAQKGLGSNRSRYAVG